MNCLIHLASLCLFDPSNVFVSVEYEHVLTTDERYLTGEWRFDHATRQYVGAWKVDQFAGDPDYGRLDLGWAIPLGERLELIFAFSHTSLIYERRDRGHESVAARLVWKPFRSTDE